MARFKELATFLEENRGVILAEWVEIVIKIEEYSATPKSELSSNLNVAFDGYISLMCHNDSKKLDQFLDFIAEKRMALGFPLHTVQRASSAFVPIAITLILSRFGKNSSDFISKAIQIMGYTSENLSVRYQALALLEHQTSMRQIEETVRQLMIEKERAEKAVTLKNNFLSNITHELRTPLTVILGFSKLLWKESIPAEKIKELGEIIHSSGSSLLRLVDETIMMAKLESGEDKIRSSYVYLNDLITASISAAKKDLKDSTHEWVTELCKPEPMIAGDFDKLLSMFFNILANAVKFSPENSKIVVRSSVKKFDALIDVIDEGIGISSEDQDTVFEKFHQKDGASARKYSGTGIGLALARMVATYHGGDITLSSNPSGKGTVFTIRLPMARDI